MERNLHMVVVSDTNTPEGRESISRMQQGIQIPYTLVTPQLVRNILPGVRATPAVGVLFWSTDLQGVVADVDAFSRYIRGEESYKKAIQAFSASAPDTVLLAQDPVVYKVWEPDKTFAYNQPLIHKGKLYRVAQPDGVIAQSHQPPDAEGMLAVYRPLSTTNQGTLDDPIPWVYGMDCNTGKYYSYNDNVYLCKGDMIPCTWEPGSAGLWQ